MRQSRTRRIVRLVGQRGQLRWRGEAVAVAFTFHVVETESLGDAHDLAEQLREEGYDVSRTFTYVIVGTATREEAVDLAERIHGRVEPGGELVYEVQPQNPFAVFGGLGG